MSPPAAHHPAGSDGRAAVADEPEQLAPLGPARAERPPGLVSAVAMASSRAKRTPGLSKCPASARPRSLAWGVTTCPARYFRRILPWLSRYSVANRQGRWKLRKEDKVACAKRRGMWSWPNHLRITWAFLPSTSALSLECRARDLVNRPTRSFPSSSATRWLMYSPPLSRVEAEDRERKRTATTPQAAGPGIAPRCPTTAPTNSNW